MLIETRVNEHMRGKEQKKQIEEEMMEKWIKRWEEEKAKGEWTRVMIKDLRSWLQCKQRKMDYFLSQALSGHGSFRSYMKRLGKMVDDECIYCDQRDDAEHTLFVCIRWDLLRKEVEKKAGWKLERDWGESHTPGER